MPYKDRESYNLYHKLYQRDYRKGIVRTPELAWPTDLYGQNMTITELMADGDLAPAKIGRVKQNAADFCQCGCGQDHKHRVTLTVRSAYGNGWRCVYFASERCKSRYVREKGGHHVG